MGWNGSQPLLAPSRICKNAKIPHPKTKSYERKSKKKKTIAIMTQCSTKFVNKYWNLN